MKKKYIAPEANIYLVNNGAVMQLPAGSGDNPGDAEAKGGNGDIFDFEDPFGYEDE